MNSITPLLRDLLESSLHIHRTLLNILTNSTRSQVVIKPAITNLLAANMNFKTHVLVEAC